MSTPLCADLPIAAPSPAVRVAAFYCFAPADPAGLAEASRAFGLAHGILAYLAEVEARDSLWQGECFLFDERMSIGHGERIGNVGLCGRCGQPIAPGAGASGGDCPRYGGEPGR